MAANPVFSGVTYSRSSFPGVNCTNLQIHCLFKRDATEPTRQRVAEIFKKFQRQEQQIIFTYCSDSPDPRNPHYTSLTLIGTLAHKEDFLSAIRSLITQGLLNRETLEAVTEVVNSEE